MRVKQEKAPAAYLLFPSVTFVTRGTQPHTSLRQSGPFIALRSVTLHTCGQDEIEDTIPRFRARRKVMVFEDF